MNEDMKKQAAFNSQCRGHIMRILAQFHPMPITIKQIKIGLEEYGVNYKADVDGLLSYLKDRKYIVIGTVERTLEQSVRLHANGVDIMEGRVEDDAVLV